MPAHQGGYALPRAAKPHMMRRSGVGDRVHLGGGVASCTSLGLGGLTLPHTEAAVSAT